MSYDVIIVGCGAAGAAALGSLARAGKSVIALEAASRIGGRVNTVKFGRGVVELGAEWIHGEVNNRVFELAQSKNVPIRDQKLFFEMYRSNGKAGDSELCNQLLGLMFENSMENHEGPEGLGTYCTRRFYDYLLDRPEVLSDADFCNEFLVFAQSISNNYNATNDWNDLSTIGSNAFEETEGHQHWSWHSYGYKTVFDILLNRYNGDTALPVNIQLNKEVISIDWNTSPIENVTVRCLDGSEYKSRTVIVTVSLGVLKERHKNIFNPPLPVDKIEAIEKISMGVMDKIVLSYEDQWWPKTATFFGMLWRGEDKSNVPHEDYWTTRVFGFSTPMGSDNVITLWTSGECAKQVETLPDDVVKRKCKELLQKFLGRTIPDATNIIKSRWYSDPLTRGSYSYRGLICDDKPELVKKLSAPLLDGSGRPRVQFAGEATHPKYFSTVHGAIDTGLREADRILAGDQLFLLQNKI